MKSLIRNIFLGLSLLLFFASIVSFIESITLDDVTKRETAKDTITGFLLFSFMFALPYFIIPKDKEVTISQLIKTTFAGISLFMLIASILAFIDSITLDNVTKVATAKSAVAGLLFFSFLFFLPYFIISRNNKIKKSTQDSVKNKQPSYSKPLSSKIEELKIEENPPPAIKEFKQCRNCSSSEIEIKDRIYIVAIVAQP